MRGIKEIKVEDGISIQYNSKTNKETRKNFEVIKIVMSKKDAEKVFGVSLKNRHYTITKSRGKVEITFFDKGNIFGWVDRLPEQEFIRITEKLCVE